MAKDAHLTTAEDEPEMRPRALEQEAGALEMPVDEVDLGPAELETCVGEAEQNADQPKVRDGGAEREADESEDDWLYCPICSTWVEELVQFRSGRVCEPCSRLLEARRPAPYSTRRRHEDPWPGRT